MDVAALRSTPDPSQIATLLDDLVADIGYVPPDARPITDPGELPLALERRSERCRACEVWRAWRDEARTWFVIGAVTSIPGGAVPRPQLYVAFYDADGNLCSSGAWARSEAGSWALCAVSPSEGCAPGLQ